MFYKTITLCLKIPKRMHISEVFLLVVGLCDVAFRDILYYWYYFLSGLNYNL